MATPIQLKHSSQAGRVPNAGVLTNGELAINTKDVKAYIKNSDGQVVQIAGADNPTTDGRYVKLDGDGTAQEITGTGGLKTAGLLESDGGLDVTGNATLNDALVVKKYFQAGTWDTDSQGEQPFGEDYNFAVLNDAQALFAGDIRAYQGINALGGGNGGGDIGLFYDGDPNFVCYLRPSQRSTLRGFAGGGLGIFQETGATDSFMLSVNGNIDTQDSVAEIAYSAYLTLDGTVTPGTQTKLLTFFDAAVNTAGSTNPNDTSQMCKYVYGFKANNNISIPRSQAAYGFMSQLYLSGEPLQEAVLKFNYFAEGNAPNFFTGSTYIGGSVSRNTRELWESTLTEEQKEQLAAGTLAIPANVSTPGDGSFVRQWWYNQQSAEDQLLIDSGELEYPSHFQAANFVDTFDLGVTTNIDLLEDGQAKFKTNVFIEGTIPSLVLDNTAAAGDYKRWRFTADKDGKLFFQAINDGGAGSGNLFQMQRTGNSVDTFDAVKDGNVWFSINNVNQTLDCNGRAEFAAGVSVTGGWPAGVVNGMGFDSGRAVRLIANSESIITLNEDNSYKLGLSPSITGDGSGSYGYGVVFAPTVTGEYKAEINLMRTQPTLAGAKTPTLNYYSVTNISSPPTEVENVSGFNVSDTIAFGTKTNFGFSSGLSENGTKSFNFYASGTAPNYFRGDVGISNVVR